MDFFDPGVSKFGGDEDSDSGDDGRGRDSMASQPTSGAPLGTCGMSKYHCTTLNIYMEEKTCKCTYSKQHGEK